MLSFSHSVSHALSDKFTHQTCEIPCEMVVVFTQYSYVFHIITIIIIIIIILIMNL